MDFCCIYGRDGNNVCSDSKLGLFWVNGNKIKGVKQWRIKAVVRIVVVRAVIRNLESVVRRTNEAKIS